ncbi:bifunctional 5,10-methylenetetrahydrofolate dehydrogenase/5,10-methenyltetrahydrofolate cyclohydrolase [Mycoplasma sp. Z386]
MPKILDGKKASEFFFQKQLNFFNLLPKKAIFKIVQVGNLEASNRYIKNKLKRAKELGVNGILIKLDENITEESLLSIVRQESIDCDGMIVQLPLPKHINSQKVLDSIPVVKDIDGLSSKNQNQFYNNQFSLTPATAKGIMMLLDFYNIQVQNKKCYIIGESNLVGKPTKKLLTDAGAFTHSFNKETGIKGSEDADILVVAAGETHLIKKENIKDKSVIIDVGINTLSNNKITGDVDFIDVIDKVEAISPVPGGVGPMTITALFENLMVTIKENLKSN